MGMTPLVKAGHQIIQGYGARGITVNSVLYTGAVIVRPESAMLWAAPRNVSELTPAHFQGLEGLSIAMLLLGTGKFFAFVPPDVRTALKAQGITIDSMDTGAACRTYNVLMAEGRRVAAALLPV